MRDRGWLALDWPVELGGQGRDPLEVLAYSEEARHRGAPSYGVAVTMMIAHVVAQLGTDEQKRELLPKLTNAESFIALGFTEPENGSDAAAATTKAVRDGEGWRITGSKMFTSDAHYADYVFLLARTDPEAPKHKGLTVFLVPMHQPGVEVQPVETLSGERTNVTFYNEAFVSDTRRIGEVNGGWQVMGTALSSEHTASFWGEQARLLDALVEWALDNGRGDDPTVTERVGRSVAEAEVSRLLLRRGRVAQGHPAVDCRPRLDGEAVQQRDARA